MATISPRRSKHTAAAHPGGHYPRKPTAADDAASGKGASGSATTRNGASGNGQAVSSHRHSSAPSVAPLDPLTLLWGWPLGVDPAVKRLIAWLGRLHARPELGTAARRDLSRRVENLLEPRGAAEAPLSAIYEALAWSCVLPTIARELSPGAAKCLADHLAAKHIDDARDVPSECTLADLLRIGELPFTLAVSGLLDTSRDRAGQGLATWERWFADVSPKGLPRGEDVPWLLPIAAAWQRSAGCAERLACPLPELAQRIGPTLVCEALRFAGHDGRPLWGQVVGHAHDASWLKAAGSSLPSPLLGLVTARRGPAALERYHAKLKPQLPPAGVCCESSRVALLRTSWLPTAHSLGVALDSGSFRGELLAHGRTHISGEWELEITVNSQARSIVKGWECECWESDDDCDYLELSAELSHGWKVARHLMLPKRDGVCLVADALLGDEEADVCWRLSLPLVNGLRVVPAPETRETTWGHARAIPLALNEWRSAGSHRGDLFVENGKLVYEVRGQGPRLFCPLWIDLERGRGKREATWRRLTVAENRRICDPDEAVGYRAQIGREQWLVYRSLAPRGNRTILGQNLIYEFVAGRLQPDGSLTEFIEIE